MTRILVPHLDANTIDVTVTAWLKQPGENIIAGEPVAELTTDKAAFELEAPASGVLLAILAAQKSIVPSGYILGLIGTAGETDPAAVAANTALMAAYRSASGIASEQQPAALTAAAEVPGERVRATPKARRLAQQKGLDLAQIRQVTGAAVIDEAAINAYLERQ